MTHRFSPRFTRLGIAATSVAALLGAAPAQAELIVGLTTTNALITFDSATPLNASPLSQITGLQVVNERILGIDARPTTGVIYGVSDLDRVYSLTTGGAASFVGMLTTPLTTDVIGIDFNPAADLGVGASLRIVSSAGQNLAFNVSTGATVVQTPIQTGFSAVAYANNDINPGTGTQLYYFDTTADVLKTAGTPFDAPTITTVGALGLNISGVDGFDISRTGAAFAAVTDAATGKSGLYTVNLGTGALTFAGAFGIGGSTAIAPPLQGLTVASIAAPIPEPETYAMMLAGLGALGFVARRRRK